MSVFARAARSRLARFVVAVMAVAGLTMMPTGSVNANYDWSHADGPGETCGGGCPGRAIMNICCIDPIG